MAHSIQSSLSVTGSITVAGSITGSVTGSVTGVLFGNATTATSATTASFATTASYWSGSITNAVSSSFATTASYYAERDPIFTTKSGSYATTASNAFTGSQIIAGDLTVQGTASIAYLNVTIESSSVIYSSGSNQFGDATNDRQTIIGFTTISGSLAVTGSTSIPNLTGSLRGNADTATTASYALTASYARNVQISGSINNVDYIDFNTGSAVPSWKAGRVFWDNTDGALSVYNAEADVTMQIGQENWTRVRNNTGTTITNGTIVRITGAQGDVPTVVRAQAIAKSGSINVDTQILGVATHDIETNSFGYVTTQGLVRGINTSLFADGDTLFVGTGSAGVLQNTAPRAPYEIIPVGVCVKAGPGGSGIIYTAVQQPLDFSDLSSAQVQGNYSYGDLWSYQQSGSYGVWRHTNQLSGSYAVTGSWQATSFTGSLQGTASYATQALSASWAPGGGTFPYTGSAEITGSLILNGMLSQGDLNNVVTGLNAHAEGSFTNATGRFAHAEGYGTNANGTGSHAEGVSTQAISTYSHAEGVMTIARGAGSHAEGLLTEANGDGSHAEGYFTQANGQYSHAEGESVTAIGNYSHAEGQGTITYGQYSHAEGAYNIALSEYQHVQGVLNLPVSGAGAFIIGAGDIYTNVRRNLVYASGSSFQITGSTQITGSLFVNGGQITAINTSSFITAAQTASMTVLSASFATTASYINPTFISASAAAAGFGTGGGSGLPFPYTGSAGISGSIALEGPITFGVANGLNQAQQTSLVQAANSETVTIATLANNEDAMFIDYVVKNDTNVRAGTIVTAINSADQKTFTETATTDLGDTSGVTFAANVAGGILDVSCTTNASGWVIKTIIRTI